MRHAQELVRLRQPLQPSAYRLRRTPTNARIHFVEHQRSRGSASRARCGCDACFKRQSQSGELAAGGDLVEGPRLFTRVWRDEETQPIDAESRPFGGSELDAEN